MIRIQNIYKSFAEKKLFCKFNLDIPYGEYVIFSGPSGCGKTTLLNMIGGIEGIDQGIITVDDVDISNRKNQLLYHRTRTGFLFQNFALAENKTVRENLSFVQKKCRADMTPEEALEKVGLESKMDQKIYSLSGGEQQRIALARLMIKKCDIILADEPTGSLDKENAKQVLRIIESLWRSGKTVIMVTHDEEIKSRGTKVVQL